MKKVVVAGFAALLMLTGCFGEPTDEQHAKKNFRAHITIDTTNVPRLENGYYEAFIFVDGQAQSIGAFNYDENGMMVDPDGKQLADKKFHVEYTAKKVADSIMITAQPKEGLPTRSETAILEGNFEVGKLTHIAFSRFDPEEIIGEYMLATYSDGNDRRNEASGVWFFENEDGKRNYLLEVPDLRGGWEYETWIEHQGKTISLGKFTNVKTADFLNRFQDGKKTIPLSPGEEFLVENREAVDLAMPLRLNDGRTRLFVTVEPVHISTDLSGDAPFTFKVLESNIPRNARTRTPLGMVNTAIETLPTGKIIYIPELALPQK